MFAFFAIIAAMTLAIFFFVIDRLGKKSDVDKVIDFLEDLIEMDAIKIEIGSKNSQYNKPTKKKKKKHGKKKKDNDSEILYLINKIDKKLQKGYTFENISISHYEKIYKDEILNLYKTSRLDGDTENSIKEILQSLLSDLREPGDNLTNRLETKASLSTLDTMLQMDGIRENSLTQISSKSVSDMFE